MRVKANVQLLDPIKVRHRRLQLGLTESYLGSLCGVSASVIRRLESNFPQDDLSARFITVLADQLGAHTSDLLADRHTAPQAEGVDRAVSSAGDGSVPDVAQELGAALLGADEPLPIEVLCEVLQIDLCELDDVMAELQRRLELVGGLLVDNGATLRIVEDISSVDQEAFGRLIAAAFSRRRPNLPELRAVHSLVNGQVLRREDVDTVAGGTLGRLRRLGILAHGDVPAGVKSDPPKLSEDVLYSLLLQEHAETVN